MAVKSMLSLAELLAYITIVALSGEVLGLEMMFGVCEGDRDFSTGKTNNLSGTQLLQTLLTGLIQAHVL